jgi:hypothetical protein
MRFILTMSRRLSSPPRYRSGTHPCGTCAMLSHGIGQPTDRSRRTPVATPVEGSSIVPPITLSKRGDAEPSRRRLSVSPISLRSHPQMRTTIHGVSSELICVSSERPRGATGERGVEHLRASSSRLRVSAVGVGFGFSADTGSSTSPRQRAKWAYNRLKFS